jgi:hypothetical protein
MSWIMQPLERKGWAPARLNASAPRCVRVPMLAGYQARLEVVPAERGWRLGYQFSPAPRGLEAACRINALSTAATVYPSARDALVAGTEKTEAWIGLLECREVETVRALRWHVRNFKNREGLE